MKKLDIVRTAIRLFATQGFDGTTTLQIAQEAGVTEPLIYYHFKGKEDLFTEVLVGAFETYFNRLAALPKQTAAHFEKIENLIHIHFQIVEEMPDETYLAVSTCPAKLRDAGHICTKYAEKQRSFLKSYLEDCMKAGIAGGEFYPLDVAPTARLMIILINGIMRRRLLKMDQGLDLKEATVEFCRRSLVRQ